MIGAFAGASGAFAAENKILHPEPLPEHVEVVNPQRGLYTWLGNNMAPQPQTSLNRYVRFSWAELEPQENYYNFRSIERELTRLPHGTKFAFRIMALNSGSWRQGNDVPAYLITRLARGFFLPVPPANPKWPTRLYIPDWNDPYFLARVEGLLQRLADKYDGDPRISWIDVGIYGNWGEWHVWVPGVGDVPYEDHSINLRSASPALLSSKQRIIDAYANAFKKTRLIMMTDDKPALLYALQLPIQIPMGMRRDSFGSIHFAHDFVPVSMPRANRDLILNRWKVAPFIVESFGPPKAFEVGPEGLLDQVNSFHIAAIGNGSFGESWDRLSLEEQDAVLEAGRESGYRFRIDKVEVDSPVERGGALDIHAEWVNAGVTPAYEPWRVLFSLHRPGDLEAAAEMNSQVELQKLFPTKGKSFSIDETFTITEIPPGVYELRVKVVDPASYSDPLQLDQKGKNSDGSYMLGDFAIPERHALHR